MSWIERYFEKREAETEELARLKARYDRLLAAAKKTYAAGNAYCLMTECWNRLLDALEEMNNVIREAEEGKK